MESTIKDKDYFEMLKDRGNTGKPSNSSQSQPVILNESAQDVQEDDILDYDERFFQEMYDDELEEGFMSTMKQRAADYRANQERKIKDRIRADRAMKLKFGRLKQEEYRPPGGSMKSGVKGGGMRIPTDAATRRDYIDIRQDRIDYLKGKIAAAKKAKELKTLSGKLKHGAKKLFRR